MQPAFDAIADPRRREILRLVRTAELPAGAIAAHFADVTRPAISQHLRTLREAGLIEERREGTRRLYRARAQGLVGVHDFLAQFWDERLGVLRLEAEREERRKQDDQGTRN